MSFSKAKIQRFNDIKACTPSPATYKHYKPDKTKPKSIVPSHTNVSENASVSETGSTQSVPCFRTPTILKRKLKDPDHATKPKAQQKLFAKSSAEQEALREKIVECENKDAFIRDLSQQLEEIADNMGKLKLQKDQLELDKVDYEQAMENLKSEHREELQKMNEIFENIMKELNEKKLIFMRKIVPIRSDYDEFIKGNEKEVLDHCDELPKLLKESLEEYLKVIENKESQLVSMEKELQLLEQSRTEMLNKHSLEMERIEKEHYMEIQDIKYEMEQHSKESKLTIQAELQQQLEEVEANWRNKLATQEKEIILRENEKNKMETDLLEARENLKNFQEKYQQTMKNYEDMLAKFEASKDKFEGMMKELKDKNEDLRIELEERNKEVARVTRERSIYEMTVKNSQGTIEVLKRRLNESDKDVDQLKVELSECEKRILEHEQKCLQLTADLKYAQTFNEELEMQYESNIKLNRTEIDCMASKLLSRVDDYQREVKTYSEKLEFERKLKNEIMQQLHDTHDMINRQKMELESIETLNSQYKFELEAKDHQTAELKRRISQLEEKSETYLRHSEYYQRKLKEYEDEQVETENIHRKYIEMSGKYDELSQKFEEVEVRRGQQQRQVEQLLKEAEDSKYWKEECLRQKEDYQALSKKYEALENGMKQAKNKVEGSNSRIQLEKVEAERDSLSSRVKHLETELKEISQRYTDLVGHQNSKQKIKHFVDLKTKNEEFVQSNMDLECKLLGHQKVIEKLKKENNELKKLVRKTKVSKEDKENFGSPNRSLNSSRIESPFRDRN